MTRASSSSTKYPRRDVFPVRGCVGGSVRNPAMIYERVSVGSITSSISNDAHFRCATRNTYGDLATIGDQQIFYRHGDGSIVKTIDGSSGNRWAVALAAVLAERAGFEPALGYSPKHAFQACDLNRSSTSPGGAGD